MWLHPICNCLLLHDAAYAGNLIVAGRPIKTMCFKKRQYIPLAEREATYFIYPTEVGSCVGVTKQIQLKGTFSILKGYDSNGYSLFLRQLPCEMKTYFHKQELPTHNVA